MGLLAVTMSPGQAIAIVIVPAIVTNIWQTFGGPYLRDIFRRLWPLMIGTAFGIWLNGGLLAGPYAPYAAVALGLLLALNAVIGLSPLEFHGLAQQRKMGRRHRRRHHRRDLGGDRRAGHPVGALSCRRSAWRSDELVQALGVFFTVATLALGATLPPPA